MAVRLSNIRLNYRQENLLPKTVARMLQISPDQIQSLRIVKKSLDARRKQKIEWVFTVDVNLGGLEAHILQTVPGAEPAPPPFCYELHRGEQVLRHRPVVVGAGPAGLFASLLLAKAGFQPLVLERGRDIDQRTRDVQAFWAGGPFQPSSNVQFGEGGAGTFSDGKLTTRVNDPRSEYVLQTLIEHGAPPEIGYINKPHIGTDRLREVVKNIRRQIILRGGEVRFGAQVTSLLLAGKKVVGVVINDAQEIAADCVILAIGHSARDTYAMLKRQGITLQPKAYAMGVRIEHPQALIDQSQYGLKKRPPELPAADYQVAYQDRETGRAAYSFCMCPGGMVVAAASEAGRVVTNGMSEYARDRANANSALVVTIGPDDFGSDSSLAGMEYQRRWEELAFQSGGRNYYAPAQRVEDFLKGRTGGLDSGFVKPSYRPGVTPADLAKCLPDPVGEVLTRAIPAFGKKIRGFDHPDAVLTGVETRTSAPVRIVRDENCVAVDCAGLYPAGEGAGYAGGIMSAAIDGLKVAEAIIGKFRPGY